MDFIEPCFGIGHNLSLICQITSEDIKHQLIIIMERPEVTRDGGKVEYVDLPFALTGQLRLYCVAANTFKMDWLGLTVHPQLTDSFRRPVA